jgi:hypothetical protein
VLCAGGIENARLLLASTKVAQPGIGNQRDLVGRFLMDHRPAAVGTFAISTAGEILKRFGFYRVKCGQNNYWFRHGFRLSPAVQRKERLLNCSAWLKEEMPKDDPWKALKRILRGKSRALRRGLARDRLQRGRAPARRSRSLRAAKRFYAGGGLDCLHREVRLVYELAAR